MEAIDLTNVQNILQGGALGILAFFLYQAYRGVRCLANRLFHEETGLVTLWVADQRAFTKAVQAANEADRECLVRNTSAVVDMCRVLRGVCRRVGVDVDVEFDRIETALASVDAKQSATR